MERTNDSKYCDSLTTYQRRETNTVQIGNLALGSEHPIRVQSMTNTNTQDIQGTVEQSVRIIEAGGELVRVTAPGIKDAEALGEIKQGLVASGYQTPLVADIHFNPNAASVAAQKVDKVRINPGNFVDKKKFEQIDYTDEAYAEELKRIREKFIPLLNLCKANNTALRVGTNHGSLSDRIMSRYGDTPQGMVESALEFLRICKEEDFNDVVLSMKASNTRVMVQAYRLLVNRMLAEDMHYPLHLGVTEAGEGEDGRIKSAVGIGALLADGLGDTIRVSLTEDPEAEIPVAKALVDYFSELEGHREIEEVNAKYFDPFNYSKRQTHEVQNIGGDKQAVVIADFSYEQTIDPDSLRSIGYVYLPNQDKWIIKDQAPEFIYVTTNYVEPNLPGGLKMVAEFEVYQELKVKGHDVYPIFEIHNYASAPNAGNRVNFVKISLEDLTPEVVFKLKDDKTVVFLLEVAGKLQVAEPINAIAEMRAFFLKLMNMSCPIPVVLKQDYKLTDYASLQLHAAADLGALLINGFGDGLMITNANREIHYEQLNRLAFNILQASRVRISKTEYISCPSCGRTLFDLQETTAKIRKVTAHLKGVKIGIMGCIVNGPGEMADADYGYVGTGHGKITLYKGKEVVERNIPSENAVEQLIELIKANGDWVEPTQV